MSGTSAGARKGWETRRRHKQATAAPQRKRQPAKAPKRAKPERWRMLFVDEYERDVVMEMERNGTDPRLRDRWMQGYELGKRIRAEKAKGGKR